MIGELLHSGDEGVFVHGLGRGLKDADFGVSLHGLYHADHGGAGHQTVGVEHDHVAVVGAPAAAEVRDIAAFALHVVLAAAVENVGKGVFVPAEVIPGFLFLNPGLGIGGVAEDEDVEAVGHARGPQ